MDMSLAVYIIFDDTNTVFVELRTHSYFVTQPQTRQYQALTGPVSFS